MIRVDTHRLTFQMLYAELKAAVQLQKDDKVALAGIIWPDSLRYSSNPVTSTSRDRGYATTTIEKYAAAYFMDYVKSQL